METVENDPLALIVDDFGRIGVVDKSSDTRWESDPWENAAGELVLMGRTSGAQHRLNLSQAERIQVNKENGSIHVCFARPRLNSGKTISDAEVVVSLALDSKQPEFSISIESVEPGRQWRFCSIQFPTRAFYLRTHEEDGYVALPVALGYLIPSHRHPFKAPEFWQRDDKRQILTLPFGSLAMPWFGVAKAKSAFIAIPEEWEDGEVEVVANYAPWAGLFEQQKLPEHKRIACCSPVWIASRREFAYPRRIKYRFIPRGGYVEMAKFYREESKRAGRLVPFGERLKQEPNLNKMVGAPVISIYGGYPHYTRYPGFEFQYSEVAKIARDLRENLGIEKAILHVWALYSRLAPKIMPFSEEHGTLDDLRRMIETIHDAGFLFFPYTYYTGYQPEDGGWDWADARMDASAGRIEVGKWDRICSSRYRKIAEESVKATVELGVLGHQVDIITAGDIKECYHPDHPQSRRDDRQCRAEFYKFLKDNGLLVLTEAIKDYVLPHCDAFGGPGFAAPLTQIGIPVPLFQLVYHDAAAWYTFWGDPYNSCYYHEQDYTRKSLQDILYGNAPLFCFAQREYHGWRNRIAQSCDIVGNHAAEVGLDEMAHHEFLTPDYEVAKTVFASTGTEVFANIGASFVKTEGLDLPPRSFAVKRGGKIVRSGVYSTSVATHGGDTPGAT